MREDSEPHTFKCRTLLWLCAYNNRPLDSTNIWKFPMFIRPIHTPIAHASRLFFAVWLFVPVRHNVLVDHIGLYSRVAINSIARKINWHYTDAYFVFGIGLFLTVDSAWGAEDLHREEALLWKKLLLKGEFHLTVLRTTDVWSNERRTNKINWAYSAWMTGSFNRNGNVGLFGTIEPACCLIETQCNVVMKLKLAKGMQFFWHVDLLCDLL